MQVEQKRREIEKDPWVLAKVLYPKYKFKDFHRDWFYRFYADERDLCLGPRNFAKTTVRGVIGAIAKIKDNPNIQIGMASDTGGQASHFASEIKMHLERNALLIGMYPYLAKGSPWTDSEFSVVGATEIKKGGTVMCVSYGSSITGYEFDIIIADDVVDLENSRTKYQRDKLDGWLGMTLIPMLKAKGIMHINGTRYHQDDWYGKLLEKKIKTNINSHKAIMDNGKSMWPELWPLEKLLSIKEDIGSIRFNAQLQNDTKMMAQGKIFRREWFKYYYKTPQGDYRDSDGNRFSYKDLAIYQTCDLALSQSESAHYFVILTFGISKLGNIYIMDVLRGRFSWNEQKSQLRLNHYKWKNDGIRWTGIESVQYQKVLLEEANAFVDVSVRPLSAQKDKVTRAMPMSAKYETGKVYHNNAMPILKDFEDELATFDEGEYDDMVDCDAYIPNCSTRERAEIRVR